MKTTVLWMSALALAVAPRMAAAQTELTGTMCGNFHNKDGSLPVGCGNSSYVEPANFDDSVPIFVPQNPINKLLVFFHGHNGSPAENVDFVKLAAQQGYDAISLDYDYGRDYVNPSTSKIPSDAHCSFPQSDGKCDMGLDEVCGCYSDCYGYRWFSIWQGSSTNPDQYPGLPTVTPAWSIDGRLKNVINWMINTKGYSRYSRYLDINQHAGINWLSVTLSGGSLGASLAGYIGKWQHVDRVIMMSGTGDKLAPNTSDDLSSWGTAFGCDSCAGTNVNGNPYSFAGCSCKNTAFGYGGQTGVGNCTLSTQAVGWVLDNNFNKRGGKNWETDISNYYGFADTNDSVNNWESPGASIISTQRNWTTMYLQGQHVSQILGVTIPDGWNNVGFYADPRYVQEEAWHGLISIAGSAQPSLICDGLGTDGGAGHKSTSTDSACSDNSADQDNRNDVWLFMLTNQNGVPWQ